MTAVYVVTNEIYRAHGLYKIGYHTGDRAGLISRYVTDLIRPEVVYFIERDDAKDVEEIVLRELDELRVENTNNNKSEWIQGLDKIDSALAEALNINIIRLRALREPKSNTNLRRDISGVFGFIPNINRDDAQTAALGEFMKRFGTN